MTKNKNILLVEPDFPIPKKSKNHQYFLPIGLLKIATFLKNNGYNILLVRGLNHLNNLKKEKFIPNEIWITSLFTYWSQYVTNAVKFYKLNFPKARIIVGGIFASLLNINEVKNITGCDDVVQGVIKKAENSFPDYDLINKENGFKIDYQIIHTSRGCETKCKFCGTWKIEPIFVSKKSIKNEIKFKKIVFYDNNLLQNPHIENILNELIILKKHNKILWCESQSGFDGRILLKYPFLAKLIKKSGFKNPRIAWDGLYSNYKNIKKQIDLLIDAGYRSKEIFIFVLYNWNIPFSDMEKKRKKCWSWKVQIADCRFRPLDQLFDNYNSRKKQNNNDYYIHEKKGWTDNLVKLYRSNIRKQNICVRHDFPFYSRKFESKSVSKKLMKKVKEIDDINSKIFLLKKYDADIWFP